MKRIIPLSLVVVVAASLYASEVQLSTIDVESTIMTDVSHKAQKSADVAQALSETVPSIDMSRRSGIANDIFIRGQKRDNISVEIDGTKVCGACPNRMDPPTSHVLASQIEEINVIEGPYDVENFGTLSGGIKVKTKAPTQKRHGEVNFGIGAWGYTKVGLTTSGGNDLIRVLVSGSSESGNQYKDGDGNTMSQQTDLKAPMGARYKTANKDLNAYKKRTIMTKAFVSVTQDQELQLSYTANRSSDVLYPNTPMDAIKDDSDIYSVAYNIKNMGDIYKNANLQYYYSKVDHPMSTEYRNSSNNPMMDTTNHMNTTMEGLKFKNKLDVSGFDILVGLDASERMWKGKYLNTTSQVQKGTSIFEATTKNMALFTKIDKKIGALKVSVGARYNQTDIKSLDPISTDKEFSTIDANIFTTYNLNKDSKIFLGFGQASRVPDARELYFRKSGNLIGTPTLKETTNQEIDLGYELDSEMLSLKVKAFYSMLSDYIYFKKTAPINKFENIDATIYGLELSSTVYASDELWFDLSAAYKKGEKDKAMGGQTDTDLADIAPLRANISATYEYMNDSTVKFEVVNSSKWSDFDADNGEQALEAWTIANLKLKHAVNKSFDITLGVNNLLDETYAQSNTYADLTLITGGTGDVMLMNEPGRYIYTNLDFKF